jgi:hypothetical protein
LRRLHIEYVVIKQSQRPNPDLRDLEDALAREGRLLATFTPYHESVPPDVRQTVPPFTHNTAAIIRPELARPGPVVLVWSITGSTQPDGFPVAHGAAVSPKVK